MGWLIWAVIRRGEERARRERVVVENFILVVSEEASFDTGD
jgi:hypothetical protein